MGILRQLEARQDKAPAGVSLEAAGHDRSEAAGYTRLLERL
jgi:hypothetical protein